MSNLAITLSASGIAEFVSIQDTMSRHTNLEPKVIKLTISSHQWISIWFENQDDMNLVNVEISSENKKAVFKSSSPLDFKTWFIANKDLDLLIVKSPEFIEGLCDILIEIRNEYKNYKDLPALVFYDQYGDPGITSMVDNIFEIENGQLKEIEVNW
jgi:hypothetical protein